MNPLPIQKTLQTYGDELLRRFLDDSNNVKFVMEPKSKQIKQANPKVNDLLRYRREEYRIHPATKDAGVHRCDKSNPLEHNSTRIREGDELTGAALAHPDMTERVVAKRAVRHSQHRERLSEIGEFSATIVHEIRNPLSTIAMALDYLNKVGQAEKAEQRLSLAASEMQRLERLLEEILLFAKPQHQLDKRVLDLSALVAETLSNLRNTPTAEHCELFFIAPRQPVIVEGDKDKLKQVWINLVTNACQATPPGGKVAVRIIESNADDDISIEVINPGTISPDVLDRIIEPFFTTKSNGLGLGLPIVERLVAAHCGELSICCDHGSAVVARVSLPRNLW